MKRSDSGKKTKNCYLENIIKSIDRNLRLLDKHPRVDKVGGCQCPHPKKDRE